MVRGGFLWALYVAGAVVVASGLFMVLFFGFFFFQAEDGIRDTG
jgi:hypothetical protein